MSSIHISGLGSDLDSEAIIEALVQVKQDEIDSYQEDIDQLNKEYTAWTEIDTGLSLLQDYASELTSYTNWASKSVSSTDEGVVTGNAETYTATTGTYEINVSQLAKTHRFNSDSQTSSTAELGYDGVFSINGQEITVTTDDTLESIAQKINNATEDMDGAGATASIIGTSLVIESQKTGTNYDMTISYVSGDDVLTDLGMYNNERASQNLIATVDDISVTSQSNTGVEDFVSGLSLSFTDEGSATITVSYDTESITGYIEDFIEGYNTLMSYLADYTEYTTEEPEDEEDTTGLLQGDSLANKIQTRSRSILTSIETNPNLRDQDYNSLYSIGIWFDSEDNELSIVDEDALNDALENHYEEVMALFRSYGDSEGNGQGVLRDFVEYYDVLVDPAEGSIVTRENTLSEKLEKMNDRIDEMESDMEEYENSLWIHFSAMESMISSIESQGDYVFSAIGEDSSS